jgi:phage I-like protein
MVLIGFAAMALNAQEIPEGCERTALNFVLPDDGSAPEWIQLLPPGRNVVGVDGRRWTNDRPDGIQAAFNALGRDMPLDWEHATELQAPQGLPAPAAGWFRELDVREGGSIWGRCEWTVSGRNSVASREYRYISPVLIYEKASGAIRRISSVGLTNRPNLLLAALNHQTPNEGEKAMWKALLKLLGLDENATEEQAMNAVRKMQGDLQTALNRAETPSLDKFVPRADYDAVIARATNAETALSKRDQDDLEKTITTEVDAALKAGKITPATVDYHKANCRADGGLDRFREFVKAAPVIGDPSGLGDKQRPDAGGKALNAEAKQVAEMFGNSAEDIAKYGK